MSEAVKKTPSTQEKEALSEFDHGASHHLPLTTLVMKTNNPNKGKTPPNTNEIKTSNRPQNKDDLDSREGEEQIFKGDDTTHNKKEKKSENKK